MITAITLHQADGSQRHLAKPAAAKILPFTGWLALAGIASITNWGWYWLAWLLAGFVVPELYTLFAKIPHGTLSNNVWLWEHVNFAHPFDFATWTWPHWALAFITWGLFGWLSLHFPFGLLR